jgi:hypothetical protein
MGGDVLAGVPGGLAELAGIRGMSQPWDSRDSHNLWLVTLANTRVLGYQGTAGSLARSGPLRFAPPGSGCHAVNVQLNW